MAPVDDLQLAVRADLRTHVAYVVRGLGPARQHVQHGQRRSRSRERRKVLGRFRDELVEEMALERDEPVFGPQKLGFSALQLAGNVALGVGNGLLALVVLRHVALPSPRDLDEIAEDLVVADLEARDTGALALARLEGRDPSF